MEQTEVTKKELAEHLGVTQARISQLVARGLPFNGRRVIDLTLALAWVRDHIDPTNHSARAGRQAGTAACQPKPAPAASPSPEPVDNTPRPSVDPGQVLLVSRAILLQVQARAAQRKERLASGEAIDAAAAREYARDLSELVRDAHLAQADRLTEGICGAAGAGADRDAIYRLLRDDNRRTLEQLAKSIASADPTRHA